MRRGDDRVTARREGRMLGGEPCEVSHVRGGDGMGEGGRLMAGQERGNEAKEKNKQTWGRRGGRSRTIFSQRVIFFDIILILSIL